MPRALAIFHELGGSAFFGRVEGFRTDATHQARPKPFNREVRIELGATVVLAKGVKGALVLERANTKQGKWGVVVVSMNYKYFLLV